MTETLTLQKFINRFKALFDGIVLFIVDHPQVCLEWHDHIKWAQGSFVEAQSDECYLECITEFFMPEQGIDITENAMAGEAQITISIDD